MIRKPEGVRYHPAYGRIMEHIGCTYRIYWNKDMLDYLRMHYHDTINEELAGCIGVSLSSLKRKARELGLKKDPSWNLQVKRQNMRIANAVCRRLGYPFGFKKGVHAYPKGEYKKGVPLSEDIILKRTESIRRWYKLYPRKASAKALKAWQTRRMNNGLK